MAKKRKRDIELDEDVESKPKSKKKSSEETKSFFSDLRQETLQTILAIVSFVAALLSLLASFDKAGFVGIYIYHNILQKLLGVGYFLLPILFLMLGASFLKGIKHHFESHKIIGSVLFFICGLGLIDTLPNKDGGIVGHLISNPLIHLFDIYATVALLIAGIAIGLILLFDTYLVTNSLAFWKWFTKNGDTSKKEGFSVAESTQSSVPSQVSISDVPKESFLSTLRNAIPSSTPHASKDEAADANVLKVAGLTAKEDKKIKDSAAQAQAQIQAQSKSKKTAISDTEDYGVFTGFTRSSKTFVPPPLSLLEKDKGKPETGDIKANANIIKRTLQNFGINVEMDEISIGPSVTRYSLKPAEGVKLSKIVALNNDLALALAAHPIRIEAPIPGKSLVGIEIPNSVKTTVGLATLLSSEEYQESEKPLLVSLGKGITGKSYFSNLAKAPHMLIAGATGSGKSVTIHAIITSLLFRNSPENLKFIMIDPKRVELTLYNSIPHLLTPVITDAKKAILALKWAGKEMNRRYDVLEKHKVRDIESYHKNILTKASAEDTKKDDLPEGMPYIAIVLDELADIMQTYPRELESAIVRLAQMSRAVGIHLILSTQRPSVNVITGLIKANVPTRVALQVSSQIDSRTILDSPGAEKLLGAGDMLYLGADMAKAVRLQSAYISEVEVKKVVTYLADSYKDEIMDEINLTTAASEPGKDNVFSANLDDDSEMGEEDDMYESAREAVVAAGKASTSYIQRKLGVGYSRAARLMDMLEEKGVIGPANGSKPREVIGLGGNDPHSTSSNELSEAAAAIRLDSLANAGKRMPEAIDSINQISPEETDENA